MSRRPGGGGGPRRVVSRTGVGAVRTSTSAGTVVAGGRFWARAAVGAANPSPTSRSRASKTANSRDKEGSNKGLAEKRIRPPKLNSFILWRLAKVAGSCSN